jgi:hypothetical protein
VNDAVPISTPTTFHVDKHEFAGTGTLGPAANVIHAASAPLVGTSAVVCHAVQIHAAAAPLAASGGLGPVPANSNESIRGRTVDAIDFLEHWAPDAPWVLTAIDPDSSKPTDTRVFLPSAGPDRAKQATIWVDRYQGRWNIYFTPNRVNDAWLGRKPKKPGKFDIGWLSAIHVDVDPRDGCDLASEQQRICELLMAHKPAFDVIVFSGGGFQAHYLLKEPVAVEDPDKAAMLNRRLEKHLTGATQCFDICHLMRTPATINVPNKVKREKGRVPALAELVAAPGNWERRYTFADLQAAAEDWGPAPPDFIDTLPVSARLRNLIRGVDDPAHPYSSRSERVFAVIAMLGAGCTEETIRAVFLDPQYPIRSHVLERNNFDRQLHKARRAVHDALDPDVRELNKTYAVVMVGGRAAIMKEGLSYLGRPEIAFYGTDAFKTWFANRHILRTIPQGDGTQKQVQKPLVGYWLTHPQRRQYEGIVFAPKRVVPGYYNFWQGFAVEPRAGDCSRFLTHILENICRGDKQLFNWVVGWFAEIFQHPANKSGSSLAVRGEQGVGKTKVGEVLGQLLGNHYVIVSDPRYVTGRFNSHLVYCLLLHADEAFWAGDHVAEGMVKDLATGKEHLIEFKGKEPIFVANYVRLLVTGNSDWIVPAGMEERRFCVLDAGTDHREDYVFQSHRRGNEQRRPRSAAAVSAGLRPCGSEPPRHPEDGSTAGTEIVDIVAGARVVARPAAQRAAAPWHQGPA